ADNGQVYLSGMALAGKSAGEMGRWPDAQCVADYRLPPESQQQALIADNGQVYLSGMALAGKSAGEMGRWPDAQCVAD
ncbi:hypothetical protein CQA86_32405, partial [Klebsiella pneumoniae]